MNGMSRVLALRWLVFACSLVLLLSPAEGDSTGPSAAKLLAGSHQRQEEQRQSPHLNAANGDVLIDKWQGGGQAAHGWHHRRGKQPHQLAVIASVLLVSFAVSFLVLQCYRFLSVKAAESDSGHIRILAASGGPPEENCAPSGGSGGAGEGGRSGSSGQGSSRAGSDTVVTIDDALNDEDHVNGVAGAIGYTPPLANVPLYDEEAATGGLQEVQPGRRRGPAYGDATAQGGEGPGGYPQPSHRVAPHDEETGEVERYPANTPPWHRRLWQGIRYAAGSIDHIPRADGARPRTAPRSGDSDRQRGRRSRDRHRLPRPPRQPGQRRTQEEIEREYRELDPVFFDPDAAREVRELERQVNPQWSDDGPDQDPWREDVNGPPLTTEAPEVDRILGLPLIPNRSESGLDQVALLEHRYYGRGARPRPQGRRRFRPELAPPHLIHRAAWQSFATGLAMLVPWLEEVLRTAQNASNAAVNGTATPATTSPTSPSTSPAAPQSVHDHLTSPLGITTMVVVGSFMLMGLEQLAYSLSSGMVRVPEWIFNRFFTRWQQPRRGGLATPAMLRYGAMALALGTLSLGRAITWDRLPATRAIDSVAAVINILLGLEQIAFGISNGKINFARWFLLHPWYFMLEDRWDREEENARRRTALYAAEDEATYYIQTQASRPREQSTPLISEEGLALLRQGLMRKGPQGGQAYAALLDLLTRENVVAEDSPLRRQLPAYLQALKDAEEWKAADEKRQAEIAAILAGEKASPEEASPEGPSQEPATPHPSGALPAADHTGESQLPGQQGAAQQQQQQYAALLELVGLLRQAVLGGAVGGQQQQQASGGVSPHPSGALPAAGHTGESQLPGEQGATQQPQGQRGSRLDLVHLLRHPAFGDAVGDQQQQQTSGGGGDPPQPPSGGQTPAEEEDGDEGASQKETPGERRTPALRKADLEVPVGGETGEDRTPPGETPGGEQTPEDQDAGEASGAGAPGPQAPSRVTPADDDSDSDASGTIFVGPNDDDDSSPDEDFPLQML